MAVSSSGSISFSQIQAEYGGSHPISLSEYYSGSLGSANTTSLATTPNVGRNYHYESVDNKITGDYLDFSLDKNLMIISKGVILENNTSSLKADVIEMNVETKNIKIFMYEEDKKVNIRSLN